MSEKNLDTEIPGGGHWSGGVKWVGLVLGPLVFIGLLVSAAEPNPIGLNPAQMKVLALAAWMAIWWLTEAIPLSATALLPIVVLPLMKVTGVKQAAAPFADEFIFVFLGGFLLGLGLEASGLHKRLALWSMRVLGTTPTMMIGAVMLATGVISMFVSNTATAIMMLPLGLSIVKMVEAKAADGAGGWDRTSVSNFGTAMLLGIAYAATIGGMGTPIGTPPNLIMVGYLKEAHGIALDFGKWMIIALPLVAVLLPAAWMLLVVMHPVKAKRLEGGREFVRSELRVLGSMRREEWVVLAVFVSAVVFWMAREPLADVLGLFTVSAEGKKTYQLTDAVIAMTAGVLLFVIPLRWRDVGHGPKAGPKHVLTWEQAEKLPWGVLLLFGGGLSMASAIGAVGLDKALAQQLVGLGGWPLWLVLPLLALAITIGGELASNTAVATMLMPILAPVAKAMGVPMVELLMVATLAASLGFALPVATPPNAIVFATGRIRMGQMVRAGGTLDIIGALIVAGGFAIAGETLMRWAGVLPN